MLRRGRKMKLNKYEWMFVRMMAKMFALIVAIIIVMKMVNIPINAICITFAVLLVLSYFIKRVYWNHLEGLELKEQMDEVI